MAKKKVKEEKSAKSAANEGVGCAILSYLLIGIIWYFVDEQMKKNSFAKFHVKQALVLLIASIIVSVALSILSWILIWIPVLGWIIGWILWFVFSIGTFILWLIGIIAAATGKTKPLPIIGQYAENLSF